MEGRHESPGGRRNKSDLERVAEAFVAGAAAKLGQDVLGRPVGLKVLVEVGWLELKHVGKLVSGPLDRVLDVAGERLERAVRHLTNATTKKDEEKER